MKEEEWEEEEEEEEVQKEEEEEEVIEASPFIETIRLLQSLGIWHFNEMQCQFNHINAVACDHKFI